MMRSRSAARSLAEFGEVLLPDEAIVPKGVRQGDRYTAQQCLDMLSQSLAQYRAQLAACIPALPQQPQGVQVALTSWTYNVGAGAACGSTLAKKANAGDWPGACNELPRWNRAGGKVVAGLTNRRAAERNLCLQSLGVAQ